MEEEKKEIAPVLKKLKMFETATFPIERMFTVRSTCSMVGIVAGMEFRTKQLNKLGLIQVERVG